eukprot:m.144504 g.144504  ORF g.144504 m.144504 type:complete len:412 (+) comp30378_c0_seq2:12-1247(+)
MALSASCVRMALVLAVVVATTTASRKFVHPGVLVGPQQLAFIQEQVKMGVNPFNETLKKAIQNTWMNSRNATSMSPDWNGTITCGYFDSNDYGCKNESADASAVLIQSYLWAVTRDEKWASRAINTMNFYSKHLQNYLPYGNGNLEAAWAADKWARAAELLSSTGANWDPTDVEAFRAMLLRASVPMLYNGSCFNGNWELAMIEGLSSIAVFTNNETLFDRALMMWNQRLPAYFYIAEDGPTPKQCRDCKPYWYNQVVFNSSVDGVSQETCRDFGHLSYGLSSTFNVAETALIQGVDLYTPNAKRLAAALEFHTTLLNEGGYPTSPYKPPLRPVKSAFVCSNTELKLSYAATYQVGLTGMNRLGKTWSAKLAQTTKYVEDYVWGLYYNDACSPFMYCYEALTHGGIPPSSL